MIYCGNHFCAYWFEGICMKEDIRLENRGVCLTCVQVDIDRSLLARQRAQAREYREGLEDCAKKWLDNLDFT